jgi:hypothetical protein
MEIGKEQLPNNWFLSARPLQGRLSKLAAYKFELWVPLRQHLAASVMAPELWVSDAGALHA